VRKRAYWRDRKPRNGPGSRDVASRAVTYGCAIWCDHGATTGRYMHPRPAAEQAAAFTRACRLMPPHGTAVTVAERRLLPLCSESAPRPGVIALA